MNKTRGLTLVEVTIATSLLMAGLAMVSVSVDQSASSAQFNLASVEADRAVRAAVQQIGRELQDAGADQTTDHLTSHPKESGGDAPSITFSRRVALTGQPSDWSAPINYRLEASPGEIPGNEIDDDADGLVDEQVLVRVQSGQATVVDRSVLELRFLRAAQAKSVTLTISIGRGTTAGNEAHGLVRKLTTTFKIRNGV